MHCRRGKKKHTGVESLILESLLNEHESQPSRTSFLNNYKYGRLGSNKLVQGVCDHLQFKSKEFNKPYPIPVGGSNGIGSWGYINGVDELMNQLQSMRDSSPSFALNHVVFATGSGGTVSQKVLFMPRYS